MPLPKREDYPVLEPEYVYRRRLKPVELLPALGLAFAAGAAGFYIARLFLQRTRLMPPPDRVAEMRESPAKIYKRTRGRLPRDAA